MVALPSLQVLWGISCGLSSGVLSRLLSPAPSGAPGASEGALSQSREIAGYVGLCQGVLAGPIAATAPGEQQLLAGGPITGLGRGHVAADMASRLQLLAHAPPVPGPPQLRLHLGQLAGWDRPSPQDPQPPSLEGPHGALDTEQGGLSPEALGFVDGWQHPSLRSPRTRTRLSRPVSSGLHSALTPTPGLIPDLPPTSLLRKQ